MGIESDYVSFEVFSISWTKEKENLWGSRTEVKGASHCELDKLKKKRKHLETDVDSLVKLADEFAQKAEDTEKLMWITKQFMNPILDFLKERHPNFQIVWGELQKKTEKTRKDLEDKMVNVVDELKKT